MANADGEKSQSKRQTADDDDDDDSDAGKGQRHAGETGEEKVWQPRPVSSGVSGSCVCAVATFSSALSSPPVAGKKKL